MNKKWIISLVLVSISIFLYSQYNFNADIQQELCIIETKHDYDMNPHTSNYAHESQLLNALYEGLFTYDALTLDPLPGIAETYEVSLDQKRWIFSIRSDAKFSNGERITAYDVRDSLIAVLNPALEAPFASLIDCIAGAADYRLGKGRVEDVKIQAKNKTVLIVELTAPTEYLPKILCHHAFSVVSGEDSVYSGAYILETYDDDEILLKKNMNYYDFQNVAIPSIRITLSDDYDENAYAFNMGLSQWVTGGVSIDDIYDVDSLYIAPQFSTEFFFFKSIEAPWDNANLRNAVINALPLEELRMSFYPASTLVLPIGTYPSVIGVVEQDVEHACDLMEAAGYEVIVNEDGSVEPTGLSLTYGLTDTDYDKERALLIAENLAQIGITVVFQTTPLERYLASISDWDVNLLSYTWAGDFADPLTFLELFRTGSSLKESDWSDAKYDQLLNDASVIEDSKLRYEKLAEAEQYLMDSGVVIPLTYPISFDVVDSSILSGWFPNALDIHPFKDIFFIETELSTDFI